MSSETLTDRRPDLVLNVHCAHCHTSRASLTSLSGAREGGGGRPLGPAVRHVRLEGDGVGAESIHDFWNFCLARISGTLFSFLLVFVMN